MESMKHILAMILAAALLGACGPAPTNPGTGAIEAEASQVT